MSSMSSSDTCKLLSEEGFSVTVKNHVLMLEDGDVSVFRQRLQELGYNKSFGYYIDTNDVSNEQKKGLDENEENYI